LHGNSTANSANAEIQDLQRRRWPEFTIARCGDRLLRIKNTKSLKCLDVNGQSTADGASIIQYTCNTAPPISNGP